jgi:uncharacterized protein YutE (UPF0331/DUF86 family)
MTERATLNADSVQRRLLAIRERLDELGQLGSVTAEGLRADWLLRAAVERVLTQLVEFAAQVNSHIVAASGKVPPAGYRDTFAAVRDVGALSDELARRIAPSAGLRNILVHQYLNADLTIVADAVAGRWWTTPST